MLTFSGQWSELSGQKKEIRSMFSVIFLVLSALLITGCATTEYKSLPEVPVKTTPSPVTPPKAPEKTKGIYHKVQKGQTLWRVAKTYNVSVEDLIAANNIPNAAAIEVGQLLLIPGANEVQDIPAPSAHTLDANRDEFAWPVKGKIISYFNDRRGEGANHGVDIETNDGDVIKASREGQVVLADYMSGYNQTLMIDHGDGFTSVYAQNRKLLVKVGEHVYKGDPVAEAGTVTKKSFLHFEIRKGKTATNPMYYLP